MVGGTPAHYENFPVASILLPPALRSHVAAVYAFARTADDFADEGQLSPARRLDLIAGWRERLHAAARAETTIRPPRTGEPADTESLFRQLAATIRERLLPVELFDDLLSAFRQDVTVHRYATWTDLLDYCSRSANPVGRLVLRIAGFGDGRLDRWSDAVCTALQLTNFWQDLGVDYSRGRIYVPADDMRRHHAPEASLAAPPMTEEWRRLAAELVSRTRRLFEEGRPVCDAVSGRLKLELRATWLGGTRILDRIEAAGFDTLQARPTIGRRDLPWFIWRMLLWRVSREQAIVAAWPR
jgi:squalene synthase HpnC